MADPRRLPRVVLLGALVAFGACGEDPPPQHPTSSHAKKKHKKKHADDDVVVADDTSADDDAPKKKHHDADAGDDDTPTKKHIADDDAPKKKHHADDDTPKKKHAADADDDTPKKKHIADASDDDTPKKKHAADDDDDTPKKKHAADADDTPKKKHADDDTPKKKHFAAASDDDAPKKKHIVDTDEDTAKKKHAADTDEDTSKKASDDDDSKQSDDDDADKPKPEPIAKREPKPVKHATKRKHKVVAKTKATPKTDADASKTDASTDDIEIDDAPPATGVAAAGTDEGGSDTDDNASADASVAAPMPAPKPVATPLALNDRALLVRPSGLEVHGGLRTAVLTLPGVTAGTSTSSTSEGLALGATYGIADRAEVGADYVLSLHPGAVKGPLTFHGAYLAYAKPKLDIAIAAGLAIDFQDSTDPTTMMTTSRATYGLELGGWIRYRATPKVSVFTGLPALPSSTASLSKLSFALPPLPYQLAIGLSSGSTIALDLPGGIGIQAAPKLYLFAMTDLAHIKIANSANAFLFADFIPVTVGGFYSLPKLDLGATLADDLKQGAGYLSFQLLARYAIQ